MSSSPTHRHWLVKSEPSTYSWADFARERTTAWTGVRNHSARQHLSAMRPGDDVLFYESVTTKAILGHARVSRAAFPDPTADEPGWVAVQLDAVAPFEHPVSLDRIKREPALAGMTLLRISRLSVQPVSPGEFQRIVRLAARPA